MIDYLNASSLRTELTILIDAINVGDIGYLSDNDGNGICDTYHSNNGTIETTVKEIGEKDYLIDTTGDDEYDHIFRYNEETREWELIEYEPAIETVDEDSDTLLYAGVILIIIILLLLLFLLISKKR